MPSTAYHRNHCFVTSTHKPIEEFMVFEVFFNKNIGQVVVRLQEGYFEHPSQFIDCQP